MKFFGNQESQMPKHVGVQPGVDRTLRGGEDRFLLTSDRIARPGNGGGEERFGSRQAEKMFQSAGLSDVETDVRDRESGIAVEEAVEGTLDALGRGGALEYAALSQWKEGSSVFLLESGKMVAFCYELVDEAHYCFTVCVRFIFIFLWNDFCFGIHKTLVRRLTTREEEGKTSVQEGDM